MSGRPPPITIPPITIPERQTSRNSNLERNLGIRIVNSGRQTEPYIIPDYSSCRYIKKYPDGTEEYGRMRNGQFVRDEIMNGGIKKRKTMKRKLKKRKTSKRKHYRV